ncbi:MAG TPA: methylmalonyl Co-A mutase-associated GTPase MeaB [Polyangia bacterium]|nr:methylmalonyl Co-A mutase-associated GTPase MeaB [Polyangia bacterium]
MTDLAARVRAGDARAAARLMRDLDDGAPDARETLAALYPDTGRAFVVGITGAPGVGKSTLVDALVAPYRAAGTRVGVIAVDPSSPFSGGALLGDRVRMQRHATDEGVFIRSLATRGQLGGLSRSTTAAAAVLDAAGYGLVLVETVGVGQAEVDIASAADAVVVVTAPGLGDGVQALKAGLLEIADVLVVNKGDRDGADLALKDLTTMLQISTRHAWPGEAPRPTPALVRAAAATGQGVPELVAALEAVRGAPAADRARRRRRQATAQVLAIVSEITHDEARAAIAGDEKPGSFAHAFVQTIDAVAARTLDPWSAAERLRNR